MGRPLRNETGLCRQFRSHPPQTDHVHAMPTQRVPDAGTVRALAVQADVDPRTIMKELKGERTRGMAGRRARAVLVEAGLIAAVDTPLAAP